MVQTFEVLQEGVSRPKLIWRCVDKTRANPWIAFGYSFIVQKKHWSKNKRKPLSMPKSPFKDDPRNPENFQNAIPMLKFVGGAYFPMRYQVPSLSYTPVRTKFNPDDQDVGGFFRAQCEPKGPANAAHALGAIQKWRQHPILGGLIPPPPKSETVRYFWAPLVRTKLTSDGHHPPLISKSSNSRA